jgi:CheY-like chemotaxis protein
MTPTPPTILIVDDEAAIRGLLIELLGDEGYAVIAATNGRTALDLARQQRPDLIVMDVMMPELDGPETVRRLRAEAETAAIPVILMSAAHSISPDRASAVAFVSKPFNIEHLLAVVAGMLRPTGE